ncbi:MAG: META domain-containing protein [Thiolinea sp.]
MFKVISKVSPLVLAGALLSACSYNAGVDGTTKPASPLKQLTAMDWRLDGIKKGLTPPAKRFKSGVPVQRYYLSFKDGHMQLRGGCNLVNGVVKIKNSGKMHVGPLMMTNRGCNTRLMQADAEIGNTLAQVSNYHLKRSRLALLGAKNILLFTGSPTPETTYGREGQRKFVEIQNASSGLQWREAKYNERWVRTNQNAPWSQTSFPGIRGFSPQPNYEYIVRIKEFRDPDNGKLVWIMDRITSQGILR